MVIFLIFEKKNQSNFMLKNGKKRYETAKSGIKLIKKKKES